MELETCDKHHHGCVVVYTNERRGYTSECPVCVRDREHAEEVVQLERKIDGMKDALKDAADHA